MERLLTGIGAVDWRERLRPFTNVWLGAGALAVLAMLLIIVLNPGFAARELGDMLERRANLELTYSGARFQFFPEPALNLSGARLVTEGGKGHQLMTAEAAIIPISLRTLLTRKLKPSAISLQQPVFNVLIDAQGRAGWSGKGDALDAALAQNSEPGEALKVTTVNGTIKFLDERNGQSFQVNQAGLDLAIDRTGAADLRGTVAIADQFGRIDAHLASLSRLVEQGSPVDGLLEAPALEASFSGLLSLRGGISMAGTFAAGSDKASKLAEWMGLRELGRLDLQELRMSGPLLSQATKFTSRDFMMRLGGTELKGEVSIDTAGSRPLIAGKLSTSKLAWGRGSAGAVAATASGWPTEPLNIGWINDVDLDLQIDAFSLALRRFSAGPATLQITSSQGTLKAGMARTAAYGGNLEATLTLKAGSSPPAAQVKLLADKMDLGQASRDLALASWLKAQGGLTIDATAEGNTIEEMISTLAGDASLSLTEGELAGIDVPASIADAASSGRQGWTATAGSTRLSELQGSFRLRDGIANSEDLKAKVAGVNISAAGDIDLLRRAIDVRLANEEKQASVAIRAFGPWRNPKLAADTGVRPAAEQPVDGGSLEKAAGTPADLPKDTEKD